VTDETGAVVTSQVTRVFWEWGDGTWLDLRGPSAVSSSHSYPQTGSYLVGVTVTAKGATVSTSKTIAVP
jgi:PKD repeat protein